jgi:hypothetical protein
MRACFVCLAATGHEPTCNPRNVDCSSDAMLLDSCSSSSVVLKHDHEEELHGASINALAMPPSTPTPLHELSEPCASLAIVQELVAETVETSPDMPLYEAVSSVICTLAAPLREDYPPGFEPYDIEEAKPAALLRAHHDSSCLDETHNVSCRTPKGDTSMLASACAVSVTDDSMTRVSSTSTEHHSYDLGAAKVAVTKVTDDAMLEDASAPKGAQPKGITPKGGAPKGTDSSSGKPPIDRALPLVLATYGWQHVQENAHMLPDVADLVPSEWTELLDLDNRAMMAAAFVNYKVAADKVEAVGPDAPFVDSGIGGMGYEVVNYINAKRRLREAIGASRKYVLSILARSFPFDPGGALGLRLHFLQSLSSSGALPRLRTGSRKVVDICSGQQSFAKFILLFDPTAEVLSIDVLSYKQALRELPPHLHHRVHYVRMDAASLSFKELERLVRKHLKCGIEDLYAIHFSPCCKSYSSADAGVNGYRLADGLPNPRPRNKDGSINMTRYEYALKWDGIVSVVLGAIASAVHSNPRLLVTIENPTAYFRLNPSVRRLLVLPGWRLLEVDYCKVASLEWDSDRVFTKN